ncbi:RNA-binding protein [Alphaproteobacteria bacterium]|nr:RNA-binding protein [Alphaproteobacteria bacterium]
MLGSFLKKKSDKEEMFPAFDEKLDLKGVKAKSKDVLVSFNMASNKPRNFEEFCENIELTSVNPAALEVLVLIDDDDKPMASCVKRQQKARVFSIKSLSKPPKGYFNLWSGLNELHALCDPSAYFVCNVNDEVRFETKNWDTKLKRYVGLFPDNIFRLRTSQFKFRNYRDFWECGYAPENYAFYTKKWIDVAGGDWNACHGPDAYQQFIAFYLWNSNYPAKEQYYRDYPLLDIKLSGEGAFLGLTEEQFWDRVKKGWIAWYRMVSHEMQEEANRRAQCLRAYIDACHFNLNEFKILSDPGKKEVVLNDQDGYVVFNHRGRPLSYSYKLSWVRITLINRLRRPLQNYYCGGGKEILFATVGRLFKKCLTWVNRKKFKLYSLTLRMRSDSNSHGNEVHNLTKINNDKIWGSAENNFDTYLFAHLRRRIVPRKIQLLTFSNLSGSHIRQIAVVAALQTKGQSEINWIRLPARMGASSDFAFRIGIPNYPDSTQLDIEICPKFVGSYEFNLIGIACYSTSLAHKRSYVEGGLGIYLRGFVVSYPFVPGLINTILSLVFRAFRKVSILPPKGKGETDPLNNFLVPKFDPNREAKMIHWKGSKRQAVVRSIKPFKGDLWHSENTIGTTIFYISHVTPILPTAIRGIIYAPQGISFLKHVSVVANNLESTLENTWKIMPSRLAPSSEYKKILQIPNFPDFYEFSIDIDYQGLGGKLVNCVGLACFSDDKNYDRNYHELESSGSIILRDLNVLTEGRVSF